MYFFMSSKRPRTTWLQPPAGDGAHAGHVGSRALSLQLRPQFLAAGHLVAGHLVRSISSSAAPSTGGSASSSSKQAGNEVSAAATATNDSRHERTDASMAASLSRL